jgi:Glycosyltransferase Family 4
MRSVVGMTSERRRRLRIALPYDALWPFVTGGAERRVHEIATRLARRHDVMLVSWRWWDGPPVMRRDDGVRLVGVGPAQQLYGADGKRRISEVAAFSVRLVPALLRRRFDVVEIPATLVAPLASAARATTQATAPASDSHRMPSCATRLSLPLGAAAGLAWSMIAVPPATLGRPPRTPARRSVG